MDPAPDLNEEQSYITLAGKIWQLLKEENTNNKTIYKALDYLGVVAGQEKPMNIEGDVRNPSSLLRAFSSVGLGERSIYQSYSPERNTTQSQSNMFYASKRKARNVRHTKIWILL